MGNSLEAVTLLYKNKMDKLYEDHKHKVDELLIIYKDEKEYIKHYIEEVEKYMKECNNLKSEFIIDSINSLL